MSPKTMLSFECDAHKYSKNMIEVIVGWDRQSFKVAEELIRSSSEFFEKALADAGEKEKSSERTIEMLSDDPEMFAIYVHWLHHDTIAVTYHRPSFIADSQEKYWEVVTEEFEHLVKASAFGDKLGDPEFQDATVKAIIEKNDIEDSRVAPYVPSWEIISYAYENTTYSAPIRKLLVDLYARDGGFFALPDPGDSDALPSDFLLGLSSKLLYERTTRRALGPPHPSEHDSEMSSKEEDDE